MDPELEFLKGIPSPLVFVLGSKESQDYLIKAYNETNVPKKTTYPALTLSIDFRCFPLETDFYQQIQAIAGTNPKKGRGLFSMSWVRKFRFLVRSRDT